MNKTLIIPDIHNKWFTAEEIIDKETPDKVIFLGDYFDDFNDTLQQTEQTAQWLKKSLTIPNRTHLLGNHDLSYLNSNHKCAGFSEAKLFIIKKVGVDFTKLLHYCWVGNNNNKYLCTHAGLSNNFMVQYNIHNLPVDKFLDYMIYDTKRKNTLYAVSKSRGGTWPHAGPLWCDYSEFVDIPGIKQIFGHTHGELRHTENSICIDTWLKYYCIYENDELKIIKNTYMFYDNRFEYQIKCKDKASTVKIKNYIKEKHKGEITYEWGKQFYARIPVDFYSWACNIKNDIEREFGFEIIGLIGLLSSGEVDRRKKK